jgi:integrase
MSKLVRAQEQDWSLYTRDGQRKYINEAERQRVLSVLGMLSERERLFILTLIWSGGRVSEVLALTPSSFQPEECLVAFKTLKRRRPHIREVPLPPGHVASLDRTFRLTALRHDPRRACERLWPLHRTTAWRLVKRVMRAAGLSGVRACPKGFRHAFGVATLRARVPSNLRQKWMGHARPSTTEIYSAVCGPDEVAFAEAFWGAVPVARRRLPHAPA